MSHHPGVTVMVVDPNAEFRRLIKHIAGDFADMIHECATPLEAFNGYRQLRPDLVVMDLGQPPCDGMWATRQIVSFHPQAVVVIVALYPDATFRAAAELAGARGFVQKENLLDLRQWLQGSGV